MRWWKGVGASVRGGRRPPSSSRLFLCDAAVNWVMADAQPDRRYSRAGRLTETEPLPLPECCALVLQGGGALGRSEEHTSELQSLMRISYAVFCLKKKLTTNKSHQSKVTRIYAQSKRDIA